MLHFEKLFVKFRLLLKRRIEWKELLMHVYDIAVSSNNVVSKELAVAIEDYEGSYNLTADGKKLAEGDKLPAQSELAETLKVSLEHWLVDCGPPGTF